ncbi:hypothetical protein GJ496_010637 [Pomphorhynchus laevis]|nr:hypothetical protein GJ496_010637 [Pomphorhynchus laevis]
MTNDLEFKLYKRKVNYSNAINDKDKGKYGNSSEQSTGAILSSITSPRYCLCKNDAKAFIDYGANKQFIQLFCQWENIVYRLEGVNQIKRMAASTSEVVKKLQLSEDKTKALDNNQLIDIENLKNLLSESLFNPAFKDASCNLLDKRLFMLRSRTINNIVQRIDEILVGDESIKTTIKILDRIRISLITASRDPQQSIPDVLIWTLINGVKVSYCRIKIEDILLTKSEEGNGIKCGKIRNVILRHPVECQLNGSDHAIVKLRMWFFASSLNPKLTSLIKENIELNAFVNIYENQILRNRKWISDDIIPWSDKAMKLLLNRDYFTLPDVLTWSSKWEIDTLNTCSSQITDKQNMWEYQSREKSGGPWMDRSNIDSSTISSDYYIDKDRHVDDDGWEYADKRDGIWVPACKFHHLHRRRILVTSIKQAAEESGGWMYSSNRNGPYHSKMWNDDTMRTLSWIRYIKPKDTIKTELLTYTPVLFKIEDKIKGKFNIVTSDSCLVRKDSFLYTVIAHIYQIRFSIKIKSSFTKQFYIRVSCLGNSQSSCLVDRNSEDPVDETIVVPGLHVCEDFEETCLCPSQIVFELYNQSNELVARALPKLTVRKHDGENKHSKFNWIPLIKHDGSNFAELLGKIEMIQIPFEGFQCDGIERNSDNTKYVIPNALKPELQYVQITILSLGLRHGWKERFLTLSNPTLVFELGGTIIKSSSLISVKNCSNFKQPIYIFRKTIPTSPEFSPCINLELIDKRSFGRNVSIGKLSTATVNTLLIRSSVNFASNIDDKLKNITKMKCNRIVEANTSVDWWSKFYFTIGKMSKCTLYANSKYQRLKVLNSTLEQQIMKYKYSHICENFQFQMTDKKSERISFKGNYFVDCLESSLVDEDILKKYKVPYVGTYSCIVRIYIIRAFNLPPMDQDGKCDPYVRIIAGDKSVNNRNDKCINTLSPIFGKIFEMKLSIPSESLLVIQVKDWNYLMHDNLIGQTVIDLEDRILARGHATCGVPQFYESCGINKWRDSVTPHQLLIQLCEERNIPVDILLNGINSKIKILNKVLTIDNFEQLRSYQFLDDSTIEQSLCLHVIHLIGAVKEHVESRPLINPVHPRLEQGTLQMWIDIFPSDFKTPIPPCVCIDPRKPKTYYLKVIVWNVRTNLKLLKMLSGEDAPDIFIRGIVDGATESVQCTDIHYRCIDGQGNYNWRFIFEVQVLSCEMSFLKMKREHFWSSEVEELSIAPKLKLQLWDNDKFSCDDFIGEVELVLTELQSPSKFPFKHAHKFQKVFDKALCIFHQTRIKGWWPVYGTGQQTNELVAQIEAEIELVSEEEFKIKPSGKGRQEPNENPRLAEPRRPITSFSFISTPYRTFRYFIWKKYKRRIILATIGTFLSAIAISFLEKIPENSWHFLMFKLKKKFG